MNGYGCDLGISCGRRAASTIAIAHEAPPNRDRTAVKRQDASVELSGEILCDPSLVSFPPRLFLYLPCASNKFSDGLCGKV